MSWKANGSHDCSFPQMALARSLHACDTETPDALPLLLEHATVAKTAAADAIVAAALPTCVRLIVLRFPGG
jgi:hypothetical protein